MKTRTVNRKNGTREVMRVLSATDLTAWSDKDPLAYEKSIVWLENIDAVRFVRAVEVRCARSRRGPLSLSTGQRVIGYAKLTADAPRDPRTESFTRRLFYLKTSDADEPSSIPPDALDPRTILPGVRGDAPVTTTDPAAQSVRETLQPGT